MPTLGLCSWSIHIRADELLVRTLKRVLGTGSAFLAHGREHRAVGCNTVSECALPCGRHAQPLLVPLASGAGVSAFGTVVGRFGWLR
jgi:hypothetical protein